MLEWEFESGATHLVPAIWLQYCQSNTQSCLQRPRLTLRRAIITVLGEKGYTWKVVETNSKNRDVWRAFIHGLFSQGSENSDDDDVFSPSIHPPPRSTAHTRTCHLGSHFKNIFHCFSCLSSCGNFKYLKYFTQTHCLAWPETSYNWWSCLLHNKQSRYVSIKIGAFDYTV